MNLQCSIEGCSYLAERNGICSRHNREARKASAPKTKARKARIAKQSEEGKERTAIYSAIRSLYLLHNLDCARCKEVYGVYMRATTVHHKLGRLSDLLYDVRHFLPLCLPCHHYVETHPEEAYERGWSLLRTQTEPHTI